MSYEFIKGFIAEGKNEKLSIKSLPYKKDELSPSISENTINYHYDKLAKTYAERYNSIAYLGNRSLNVLTKSLGGPPNGEPPKSIPYITGIT